LNLRLQTSILQLSACYQSLLAPNDMNNKIYLLLSFRIHGRYTSKWTALFLTMSYQLLGLQSNICFNAIPQQERHTFPFKAGAE
jgi:hypothetical protein